MQPMQIDAGDDQVQVERYQLKACEQFDPSPSDLACYTEFPGRRRKMLLKHLSGYDAPSLNSAFINQVQSDLLFGRSGLIVGVHGHVHAVHRG